MRRVLLLTVIIQLIVVSSVQSDTTYDTLIFPDSPWEYAVLDLDLWPNWNNLQYSDIPWDTLKWEIGNAPFGNTSTYGNQTVPAPKTNWLANTDLALQKRIYITPIGKGKGNDTSMLNVSVDNGIVLYVNGVQVIKINEEGFTTEWEYTYPISSLPFNFGWNTIRVLIEDHGTATYFNMCLRGDFPSFRDSLRTSAGDQSINKYNKKNTGYTVKIINNIVDIQSISDISIFDMRGVLVKSVRKSHTINISGMKKGCYLLKTNDSFTKLIIK
jgi:hypothetical protein